MVSTPAKSEPGAQPQDVFQRLVLTLSGRNDPASPLTSPKEPTASPESPSTDYSAPGEPLERVVSSSSSKTKRRLNIGDRLKKLRKDMGKLRKNSDKVTVTEIPPAATSFSPGPSSGPYPGHAKLLSMVAEVDEPVDETLSTRPADPPEATSLAKRIQSLNPKPPARDADGRPIPPPNASPIKDSRLLSFLSSPTIMNGSAVKGRPSIWSILEGIGAPAHGFPPSEEDATIPGGSGEPSHGDRDDQDTIFSDNSSIMIYSPLIPTKDDLVELAELVPVGVEEEVVSEGQEPTAGTSWTTMWPLSLWYGESPQMHKTPVMAPRRLSGETVISPRRTSTDSAGRVVRVQTVRAWVPSNTKLSVQAMWWGYRLYLPPPVLAILSDKTLEATKRAAMITTALTWFFNHLPVDALPTPVRPAALLLQRLAPYLGYIGTFISWSWSTIKSYDIGYGVILTATWLLPIALIPGTWHERDFPTSPTQGSPAPLPPMSPSSSGSPSLLPTSPPTSPNTSLPTSPSLPPTSTPGSASISLASSSPPPITSPGLSSFSLSPLSPTSPRSNLSRTVPIPVAPLPVDVPPIPPTPTPLEVPLGSPLMAQLLNGPVISTVPLPDEDAEVPQEVVKPRKDRKSRAKALFIRSPKLG
ncbi:hypothetical protein BDZ97DRAFT_1811424 [Flammula alnicola]|nr:hypothetical protein BDZ97DRAFT_1811424 [Flammula alnicola]